jgi:DNA repair exonuclease SbcCD ATPase subunit
MKTEAKARVISSEERTCPCCGATIPAELFEKVLLRLFQEQIERAERKLETVRLQEHRRSLGYP